MKYEPRISALYIPTYRRVDKQETWERLSDRWKRRTFLVACPDEVGPLRDRGYRVLECPMEGIAATRQWIIDQHDTEILGDVLMMMDDDLLFYKRRADSPSHFTEIHPGEGALFDEMMNAVEGMMGYVAVGGISPRSGANRHTAPYLMNTRMYDGHAFNVRVLREEGVRIDRVTFMEDFDVLLQMLEKGYPNLALNTHCKGDRGSNNNGGCSTYRDAKGQAAAAFALWELHPDYVRITQRVGWMGLEGEGRTDVGLRWKKAYDSGVLGREILGREQEPDLDRFTLL